MDEIKLPNTDSMEDAGRDKSTYDISDVADENAADYINNMKLAAQNSDLATNLKLSQKYARTTYFDDPQEIAKAEAASERAKAHAAENLSQINLDTLSNSDYEKMLNATINSADPKGINTLDAACERSAILRHAIGELDDKSLHAVLNSQNPKFQAEIIETIKEQHPEALPSEEQLNAYKKDIKEALIDGKPRPELTDMKSINANISAKTSEIYNDHVEAAINEQTAQKAAATRRFSNGLSGISSMSSPDNTFNY